MIICMVGFVYSQTLYILLFHIKHTLNMYTTQIMYKNIFTNKKTESVFFIYLNRQFP